MKNKIIPHVFTVSFILTGCGIDSIFTGHALEWGFLLMVTLACGYVLMQ